MLTLVGLLGSETTINGDSLTDHKSCLFLSDQYTQPLRIETIAHQLGMSISGFHTHFKAATNMSPVQFQKQLRLQEAQRLMLSEGFDAGKAAYRVGYEDQSHFSRDYKRQYGEPPARDIARLRKITVQEMNV
ncbi:helix-turn-helix transcriptional regulator [Salmonella enterica]|nr:helix-turn-helix transcriptional regulator [Salmonella enterica]